MKISHSFKTEIYKDVQGKNINYKVSINNCIVNISLSEFIKLIRDLGLSKTNRVETAQNCYIIYYS